MNVLFAIIAAPCRLLATVLKPVLSVLFGQWTPPAWCTWVVNAFRQLGQKLKAHALVSMLVMVAALGLSIWTSETVLLSQWRSWAPAWMNVGLVKDQMGQASIDFRIEAPGVRDLTGEDGSMPRLTLTFNAPVAPSALIGKETQDITLEPAIAGRWFWETDRKLTFEPKKDWPIEQRFKVKFGKLALADAVSPKRKTFEFNSAKFSISMASPVFYQDPTQPTLRSVLVEMDFSHPVDAKSLEANLQMKSGTAHKFSVSYDKLKLHATAKSEPLPIPAKTQAMTVRIASGVKAQSGGPATTKELKNTVDIPGLYSLTLGEITQSVVSNEKGEPEQVIHVTTSMPVHEREMDRAVQVWLLPEKSKDGTIIGNWQSEEITASVLQRSKKIKIERIPSEREEAELHSYRLPLIDAGRSLYIRVDKELKSAGGYRMDETRVGIRKMSPFAPEISIMSRGSLLALSGERKLPVLVRDLPGVTINIARVLPKQLHLLVSQASGDFSQPYLYGGIHGGVGANDLTEQFEKNIALELAPGQASYQTIDFNPYLKSAQGERRGVFLVMVNGYDPKAAARKDTEDEGEDVAEQDQGSEDGDAASNGAERASRVNPRTVRDHRLILVTDLGLIAKRSIDGTYDIYVQSISSGLPVSGAKVDVLGRNGLPIQATMTDENGRARVGNLSAFIREKQPLVLVAQKEGDMSFLPFGGALLARGERNLNMSRFDIGGLRSAGVPNQMTAFVFSDRGIYRPGDTIHAGIAVKAGDWSKSLAGIPVEAEVIDARGLSVSRQTLRLGASGTAEISYATQDSSPTGTYSINLSLPRQTGARHADIPGIVIGSTAVKVQEFMPDRTRVLARLSSETTEGWVKPQDLSLRVNVQNLFGTPAQSRRVDAKLKLSPVLPYFKTYADYRFFDETKDQRVQQEELQSVETDEHGNANIDLQLQRYESATYQLDVVTRAFEPEGGRSVAAEAKTLVSDRPYLVGVKTTDALDYVSRDAQREVLWQAIDPKAQKIAISDLTLSLVEHRAVSVLVKQYNVFRYESRIKDVTLESKPFKLDQTGTKTLLNTTKPGNFSLQLKDKNGLVLNRVEYTVAGNANVSRSLERNAELQIKLNKKEYQPGEEIELSIQAPYIGAGLITIERDKVYTQAWFKTDQTASVQRIQLPKDFEGTGYVSVQFVRDPSSDEIYTSPLSYGTIPFATAQEKRVAKIKLTSEDLLKPGDTLHMKLVSDKPVRAFVYAVDEGILQVARYKTPDPFGFFFQKRALEVRTSQTLDMILPEFRKLMQSAAPGGDDEGLSGNPLNPFKRKQDLPVVFWSGLIDVEGEKDLTYTIPEYFNGSIRVIAVAINDDAVASASRTAVVRGEMVILPSVPVSLSPGDEIDVGVGIANNMVGSGRDAPIDLKLTVSTGLEVVGPAQLQLKTNEGGESRAVFRLRALSGEKANLGSADATFVASHGKSSVTLTTSMSVRPASAYQTQVQSGTLVGAGELKTQLDTYPNFARNVLSVSASPWAFAPGLIAYLENYPFDCTEQLLSQTVPAVVLFAQTGLAAELNKTRSMLRGEQSDDPKEVLNRLIGKLRARQEASGGFAIWPSGPADEAVTIYAVQLLLEARERKLPVPQDLLSKASGWLQARLAVRSTTLVEWRLKTQIVWVLSRQGILVPAALANLRDTLMRNVKAAANNGKKATSPYETDLGSAYLAASYKLVKQENVAQELMQPVWAAHLARVKAKLSAEDAQRGEDLLLLDSSLLLLAARHFPDKLQDMPVSAWNRMASLISEGRYSTQSSASLILAVDAYAQASSNAANGKLELSANGSDGNSTALILSGELRDLAQATVPRDTKLLKLKSTSPLPLFYGWAESGYERTQSTKALLHGLEVTQVLLNAKGESVSQVQVGEEVTVKLTVRALDRDAVRQVALVSILPAGLEPIEQPTSTDDESDAEKPIWLRRIGGQGNWSLEYAQMRDDRVVFYGGVGRNTRDISFQARATNAGQFALPAAFAEVMYERRVFGRSAAGQFAVVPMATGK